MGLMKEKMAKSDFNRNIALEILERLGIIEICEVCGYYTAIDELTSEVYAKATAIAKKEYSITDFELFHDSLKSVYDESGIESIEEHIDSEH